MLGAAIVLYAASSFNNKFQLVLRVRLQYARLCTIRTENSVTQRSCFAAMDESPLLPHNCANLRPQHFNMGSDLVASLVAVTANSVTTKKKQRHQSLNISCQMRQEEDVYTCVLRKPNSTKFVLMHQSTAVAASTEMLWLCTRCDRAPQTATATLAESLQWLQGVMSC